MKNDFPLFYFKPTICWLDDDQIFLDAANIMFSDQYHCEFFNDADAAITFLNRYQPTLSRLNLISSLDTELNDVAQHQAIDIDLTEIARLSSMPERSNEIAILVIDYNMPGKNGLEICKQLKDTPYKKILLTGAATHAEAVDAFNNGLIDRYVEKGINITEKLQLHFDELCQAYFHEQTNKIIEHIETTKLSPFSDPAFTKFFKSWCRENHVSEYYLLNKTGTFLIKYADHSTAYFVLMSEQEKTAFAKTYYEVLNNTNPLTNSLLSGKSIPFFGSDKEAWQFEREEWENYFYPANRFQGRESYYWTVVGE